MDICTFIGHKDCKSEIKDTLYDVIEKLIVDDGVKVFYVGVQGNFDKYVYQTLLELEKKYILKIVVVLAYLNNKRDIYYDMEKTEFPLQLENVPLRFAISKRNEYMLKKSRYLVCYVNDSFSNSYKFVERAKKLNLKIINIGKLLI